MIKSIEGNFDHPEVNELLTEKTQNSMIMNSFLIILKKKLKKKEKWDI